MNQLISVIMATFNSEQYIIESINSVISQSYENWELMIVDDGSTDNTGTIIDEYEAIDIRIKVAHIRHGGVSHARNIGLEYAKGEWITFLDSDDLLDSNALQIMINDSNKYDLIIGNWDYFPVDQKREGIKEKKEFHNFRELGLQFIEYLNDGLFASTHGKMIRRSSISTKFCEKYQNGEDTLFFASLIKNVNQILFIPNLVYRYRIGNMNSLSHQINNNRMETIEKVYEIYNSYFDTPEISKIMQINYLRSLISAINDIINKDDINDEMKRFAIKQLLESNFLHSIPIEKLPFTAIGQRKAIMLLIGDVDIIMNEFIKTNKKSNSKET